MEWTNRGFRMKIMNVSLLLLFLSCILSSGLGYAQTRKIETAEKVDTNKISAGEYLAMISTLSGLNKENKKLFMQIEDLKSKLLELEDSKSEIKFVEWIGILLAAVSAIVTVLGVFIAIFSFFGYKKIVSSTTDLATTIATDISTRKVTEIAQEKVPASVQDELIKLVDQGRFDNAIHDAVIKVTFRGVARSHEENMQEKTYI